MRGEEPAPALRKKLPVEGMTDSKSDAPEEPSDGLNAVPPIPDSATPQSVGSPLEQNSTIPAVACATGVVASPRAMLRPPSSKNSAVMVTPAASSLTVPAYGIP